MSEPFVTNDAIYDVHWAPDMAADRIAAGQARILALTAAQPASPADAATIVALIEEVRDQTELLEAALARSGGITHMMAGIFLREETDGAGRISIRPVADDIPRYAIVETTKDGFRVNCFAAGREPEFETWPDRLEAARHRAIDFVCEGW